MTELQLANLRSTPRWSIYNTKSSWGGYWWTIRESSGTRTTHEGDIPWQNEQLFKDVYGHSQTHKWSY